MSKLARALTLAALLAAMSMAGMTAIAQAHTTDQPTAQADATVRRLLARERSSIPNQTPTQAAARPRLLMDEERSSLLNIPNRTPAQAAAEPSEQTGWRTPGLDALAAVLALVAVVAVLVARHIHRGQRAEQTT
jgi:DMSO/TMAO reductase YedYZ molybdopterin-dependent catalytic subunit